MKKELREYLGKIGRKGGQASAAKLTRQQRCEKGQAAVRKRWDAAARHAGKKVYIAKRRMRRMAMSPRLRLKNDFAGSLYRHACPSCGAQPFEWCVTIGGIPRPGYPHSDRQAKLPPKSFRRTL